MLDAVVTPLHEAQMVLTAMAANDLTKTMTGHYQGEFEQMKSSLNGALNTLSTAISTVRDGAESVTAGAEQITKGNEDLSQRTSEQASALEETSASMEEMTSTVKQNADNAKQANQLAIAARDIADKGGSVTVRAVEAMGDQQEQQEDRGHYHRDRRVAFQTNLLALNAAVWKRPGPESMVAASRWWRRKSGIWPSGRRPQPKKSRIDQRVDPTRQ